MDDCLACQWNRGRGWPKTEAFAESMATHIREDHDLENVLFRLHRLADEYQDIGLMRCPSYVEGLDAADEIRAAIEAPGRS